MKDNFTRSEVEEIWAAARQTIFCKSNYVFGTLDEYENSKEVKYLEGIISFANKGVGIPEWTYKISDGRYMNSCGSDFSLKELLNDTTGASVKEGSIVIWSVKNGSGETLTVGTNTNYEEIKSFHIANGIIWACFEEKHQQKINDVHPIKALLTEDGYEIKDKETYHIIYKKDCALVSSVWGDNIDDRLIKIAFIFKSIGNAEKYIDLNKPRYSKQQILDMSNESISTKDTIFIDKKNLGI